MLALLRRLIELVEALAELELIRVAVFSLALRRLVPFSGVLDELYFVLEGLVLFFLEERVRAPVAFYEYLNVGLAGNLVYSLLDLFAS